MKTMLSSERFRRLFKEGFWIVLGQVAGVLASLGGVRVLTGMLKPEAYGELALGLTVATLVNQVAIGGISAGIGRFYSIAAEKQDLGGYLRDSCRLLWYAGSAVTIVGLVCIFGLQWLGYSHWMFLAAIALLFSVISGLNTSLSSIQNAARQRAIVAFHGGLDACLKILLAVLIMFWLGASSTAVVAGYACSSLFVTCSQIYFLKRTITYPHVSSVSQSPWTSQMWAYSWPMAVAGLFNWGYYASQRWALQLFASTYDVGRFYALTQIAYTPISMAGAMLLSFLIPILFARTGDATDLGRLKNTHRLILRIALCGFTCTVALALSTFAVHDLVFRLFVAEEYRSMSAFMPYVVFSAGILQVSQTIANIAVVENQTKRFLPLAIIGNSAVALMNLYFTRRWGISGLISGMLAGAVLHFGWMIVIVSKNVKKVYGRSASLLTPLKSET
jgi:O-antigen/teichoic acid export membrane protein